MALSNVRWKGIKALEVMSQTLPDRLGGRKLSRAYKFALKPTEKMMQENISGTPKIRSKKLWYSIGTNISGRTTINDLFGVTGPRRKRNTWNMSGWQAHIIESGSKPHKIPKGNLVRVFGAKKMPIFTSSGFTGKFARQIKHKGSRAYKPFRKAMDTTWMLVAGRVSDKVAEIMRDEIRDIWNTYGQVVTRNDL